MSECFEMNDMLIDYVNHNLSREQNNKVILHLSKCKNCLNEVSFLIKLKSEQEIKMNDIPKEILKTAFDKIDTNEKPFDYTMIKDSIKIVYDILDLSFVTVNKAFTIASKVI